MFKLSDDRIFHIPSCVCNKDTMFWEEEMEKERWGLDDKSSKSQEKNLEEKSLKKRCDLVKVVKDQELDTCWLIVFYKE